MTDDEYSKCLGESVKRLEPNNADAPYHFGREGTAIVRRVASNLRGPCNFTYISHRNRRRRLFIPENDAEPIWAEKAGS